MNKHQSKGESKIAGQWQLDQVGSFQFLDFNFEQSGYTIGSPFDEWLNTGNKLALGNAITLKSGANPLATPFWGGPSKSLSKSSARMLDETAYIAKQKVKLGSPEFFATMRRRLAGELLRKIDGLKACEASEHLAVHTQPIVEELREAIKTLEDSKTEGNSRAILRQIRDCFLNGGWEQWRDAGKRKVGGDALAMLSKNESVTRQDVENCFDKLLDAGLTPVALPVIDCRDDAIQEVEEAANDGGANLLD